MKQLLSLFLFLLPCLAWAQYPSNGNQKITLGEQTTADGLIWRGIASDTTLTVKSDTAAYFVLDTANINLYTYKVSATGRKWRQLGADTAAIAYVNTYGNQTVNGEKTFTSALTATRFNPTANTATGTGMFAPTSTSLGFSTDGTNKMRLNSGGNLLLGTTEDLNSSKLVVASSSGVARIAIKAEVTANSNASLYLECSGTNAAEIAYLRASESLAFYQGGTQTMTLDASGNLGIGTATPSQKLHVNGNAMFTAVGAGAYANDLNITSTGVLTTASSDEKYKYNILPINYGLNTILQLNPVNFQWIKGEENDLGFIAQDVAEIIPEAVDTNWNSDLLMRYESIIPILTKAIQEQQALIKALEQRIINLENK